MTEVKNISDAEGKCFSMHGKKWHSFKNQPFKEGDFCECEETKIINGVVTKI